MADLVKVQFLHSHGAYNPGEVAGFQPDQAKKLCGGKHPAAVLVVEKPAETAKSEPAARPPVADKAVKK